MIDSIVQWLHGIGLHTDPALAQSAEAMGQQAGQALGQIDLIACNVMRLTNGFKLGLDMAHVGHAIFEIRARLFHRGANLVLI